MLVEYSNEMKYTCGCHLYEYYFMMNYISSVADLSSFKEYLSGIYSITETANTLTRIQVYVTFFYFNELCPLMLLYCKYIYINKVVKTDYWSRFYKKILYVFLL